jgi:hypothetical protein
MVHLWEKLCLGGITLHLGVVGNATVQVSAHSLSNTRSEDEPILPKHNSIRASASMMMHSCGVSSFLGVAVAGLHCPSDLVGLELFLTEPPVPPPPLWVKAETPSTAEGC